MLKLEIPKAGLRLSTKSKFPDESLSFNANAISILVGPNGGGKTTLLRAILAPDEAQVTLLCEEEDLSNASPLKRSKLISYVGTTSGYRPRISVEDFLSFSFYKEGQLGYGEKLNEILSNLGIQHLRYSRIDQLSEGEYKRAHIAGGLLQDAKWYLLDEPEEHLDPVALKNLAKTIRSMKQNGKSFLLACHNLNFANYLADYFIGINLNAEVAFSEDKKTVLEGKLLDKLFLCEFSYNDTDSSLMGLKYE